MRITPLCAGPSKLLSWGAGTAPGSLGILSQHRKVLNHISIAFPEEIKEAEVQENWALLQAESNIQALVQASGYFLVYPIDMDLGGWETLMGSLVWVPRDAQALSRGAGDHRGCLELE